CGAVADHASGRNGRGHANGLPGTGARRLAACDFDRSVARDAADEAASAGLAQRDAKVLRFSNAGEALHRQAIEGAPRAVETGADRSVPADRRETVRD